MQTLPFWNSIEKCGLPNLVHETVSRAGTPLSYSDFVLLVSKSGKLFTGRLRQSSKADEPKIMWCVDYNGSVRVTYFTHWAYIPAVPKKEEK